jgi:hypothetical protein
MGLSLRRSSLWNSPREKLLVKNNLRMRRAMLSVCWVASSCLFASVRCADHGRPCGIKLAEHAGFHACSVLCLFFPVWNISGQSCVSFASIERHGHGSKRTNILRRGRNNRRHLGRRLWRRSNACESQHRALCSELLIRRTLPPVRVILPASAEPALPSHARTNCRYSAGKSPCRAP